MIPLAWAFALLALIFAPLIAIGLQGARMFLNPTPKRKRAFLVALLTVPLLVPAWFSTAFLASLGWVPRPHLPDPGSGEATLCALLSIALAYGCSSIIVMGFASVRSRRRRIEIYNELFNGSDVQDYLSRPRN